MAVLMTARIPGGTKEMIDGITSQLREALRNSPGFVTHVDGPVNGDWQVVEVWDSREQFETWFENRVRPAFPEGAPTPEMTFSEVNEVIAR